MSRTHSTPASSPNFQLIFNNALKVYEKQTKRDLLAHPLAAELQSCDSPASILAVLQQQVQDFNRSRSGNERLTKWLDPTVNVLYAFSETLGEGVSLVFLPAKVIFAGVGILLSAAKDVRASQDTLVDIFERIENFFRRLENYTEISPTPQMMDIIGKILIEVLSILAITTKEIKQGRTKKYIKRILGRTDVEDALKRLDKLTDEEARMATAQVLRVTRAVAEDVDQVKRNQLWESFHKWLSPPDPSTNHNIACSTHQKRTASWFFQGIIFAGWKSTDSLLWIHGKPGSGKSILCSTIIQDIKAVCKSGQASMGYFYFDFRDAKKQTLHDLVPSLLTQLSAHSDSRRDILSRLYEDHDNGKTQPSDDLLTQCLKSMLTLSDQHPIYLIIDAIDECPDSSGIPSPREQVLRLIMELVKLRLPNIHICVTSRPEIDIREVLEPLTSRRVCLHDQTGQKEDIANYIRSVVYSDLESIMKKWRIEDKELVIETLSERADGMFRWVFCQLDTLRRSLPSSICRTLKELPESLDETYERVLRDIKKPNRDLAHRLLQCLVVAIRPLRVVELAEVLAIDFDDEEGTPKLNSSWRWEDHEQALLLSCSSLISIVENDDRVDINRNDGDHSSDASYDDSRVVLFSHFSVKEFLTSPRLTTPSKDVSSYHIDLEPSHTIMAQACLSVLLRLDDGAEENGGVGNSSSLARYAAEHWVTHAQFRNVFLRLQNAVECLFDLDKPYFKGWLRLSDIDIDLYASPLYYFSDGQKLDAGPLYYAALCGFKGLVEKLIIKYPHLVNANGGYYQTPALAALARRHMELARILQRHGSSVDLQHWLGRSPLHSAARRGDSEIIQVLLDWKLNINSKSYNDETSLYLALRDQPPNYFETIQLLLEYGADPNARTSDGSIPLHLASGRGMVEVSRLLLRYGADVEAVNNDGKTAFQVASKNGRDEVAKVLLAHGTKDIS